MTAEGGSRAREHEIWEDTSGAERQPTVESERVVKRVTSLDSEDGWTLGESAKRTVFERAVEARASR